MSGSAARQQHHRRHIHTHTWLRDKTGKDKEGEGDFDRMEGGWRRDDREVDPLSRHSCLSRRHRCCRECRGKGGRDSRHFRCVPFSLRRMSEGGIREGEDERTRRMEGAKRNEDCACEGRIRRKTTNVTSRKSRSMSNAVVSMLLLPLLLPLPVDPLQLLSLPLSMPALDA